MKHDRRSGRVSRLLRPVLLGGAAAAAWLALSATAASADSGPGSTAGTDGLSTVMAGPASAGLDGSLLDPNGSLPLESEGGSPGLLHPAVTQLTGTVDQLVASFPVAAAVVPAGAASELVSPLVSSVDASLTETAPIVLPAVSGLVPIAGPILDPVGEVLADAPVPAAPVASGVAPGPVETATLSVATPALDGPVSSEAESHADQGPRASESLDQAASGLVAPAVPLLPAGGAPLGERPDALPAGPGSGAGSGQSPSGPGAGVACEATGFVLRPPPGRLFAGEPVRRMFQPVSFDPGSSPD